MSFKNLSTCLLTLQKNSFKHFSLKLMNRTFYWFDFACNHHLSINKNDFLELHFHNEISVIDVNNKSVKFFFINIIQLDLMTSLFISKMFVTHSLLLTILSFLINLDRQKYDFDFEKLKTTYFTFKWKILKINHLSAIFYKNNFYYITDFNHFTFAVVTVFNTIITLSFMKKSDVSIV